ncbi:ABC transporter substrate-binding protein [Paenibacillus kobensis]|uniref:ABC transporter substrate-binding protein n=1 Tax=Paenibacillus kobensis TaxID=59841 RepID=UPI000FD86CF3|nr:extracellular solute-binding protein [Paenibacillus kobensis]
MVYYGRKTYMLAFAIIVVFAGALLSSCGKEENHKREGGQLAITVPYSSYKEYLESSIVQEFRKVHPDINVTVGYSYNDFKDDFSRDVEGSVLNQLEHTDLYFGITYAQYDYLKKGDELTDLRTMFQITDFKENKLFNPIIEALSEEKRIFAMPMGFFSNSIAYNVSIFDELGILYPNERNTWDELYEISEKIVEKSNKKYSGIVLNDERYNNFGKALDVLSFPLQGDLYEKKGDHVVIKRDKMSYFIDFYKKGIAGDIIAPRMEDFWNGRAGMGFFNLYDYGAYDNGRVDYKIISAPYFAGSSNTYVLPGDMFAIPVSSSNKQLAWTFIDFAVRNYGPQFDSGSTGWFPVLQSERLKEQKIGNVPAAPFYQMGTLVKQQVPIYSLDEYFSFNEILHDSFNQLLSDQITKEQFFRDTADQLTTVYKQMEEE